MAAPRSSVSRSVVLVANPHSGRNREALRRAREAMAREGLQIVETLSLRELERLRGWVTRPAAERPLIVAAGGDGTVGAVAGYVATTDAILGILPLGTSNDVARSLGIPMRLEAAAHLLATGKIATVDGGQFVTAQGEPHYFVHAAAMGLDVTFARLASQVSMRKRLGRFTYVVAGALALRERRPFECELRFEGRRVPLRLLHLSIINAPIFGGLFGFRISGSDVDDRRLDVLAIEDVPLHHLVLAAVPILLRRCPRIGGVRVYHLRRLRVHTEAPLDVSLDGELAGRIPGDFVLVGEALRVVTPFNFVDIDD